MSDPNPNPATVDTVADYWQETVRWAVYAGTLLLVSILSAVIHRWIGADVFVPAPPQPVRFHPIEPAP